MAHTRDRDVIGSGRSVRRGLSWVAVVALLAAVVGCSTSKDAAPDAPSTTSTPPTTTLVGNAVTVDVTPDAAFAVPVDGVGVISGSAGSVSTAGTVTVQAARADLPDGATLAGDGLSVTFDGTELVTPIDVSFEAASAPAGDAIAAVAHADEHGRWTFSSATVDQGSFVESTDEFSVRLPAWLDPSTYLRPIGDFIAQTFGGRTSPESCPDGAPSWGSTVGHPSSVHLCTINNPDGGRDRFELRLKSNRGVLLEVDVPSSDAAYAWVGGLGGYIREPLAASVGRNPDSLVHLPAGALMTIGFDRPERSAAPVVRISQSSYSVAISVVLAVVELAVGDHLPEWASAVLTGALLTECRPESMADLGASDVLSLVTCALVQVGGLFADPRKAVGAAVDVLGSSLDGHSSDTIRTTLGSYAEKMKRLGTVLKVIGLAGLGSVVWSSVADSIEEILSQGRSSEITVHLAGAGSPSTTAPSTSPPTTAAPTEPRPPSTAGPTSPPPTTTGPAQPTTYWAQQASRGANTFTNPVNASGQGPRIEPNQWVQVACKVKPATTIDSAYPDGYWYRIASSPWNGQYYAVANTFWNGDVPGETPYTHFTDWSIPDC